MGTRDLEAMLDRLTNIGQWEITGRISQGAFGVVFSAQRRRVDRSLQTAAIKIITPEGMAHDDFREMFVHEFKVLQGLRSKYIPGVVDSGIEKVQAGNQTIDLQWFAMDEIRGDNLESEIKAHGPLDTAAWLDLAHDLMTAVTVTHSNRLIHQDIKPANVMRFSRHSVLVDFGGASFVHIQDPGDVGVYTLGYCAPEQIEEGVDPSKHEFSIDLFACGATLAYAATGIQPWKVPNPSPDVKNEREAMLSMRKGFREAVLTSEPNLFGVDPEVEKILRTLIARDPKDRGTAEQTLKSIKELLPENSARKHELISDVQKSSVLYGDKSRISPEAVSAIFSGSFGTAAPQFDSTLTLSIPSSSGKAGKREVWVWISEDFTYLETPIGDFTKHAEFLGQIVSYSNWGIGVKNDFITLRTVVPTDSVYSTERLASEFEHLVTVFLNDASHIELLISQLSSGELTQMPTPSPRITTSVQIPSSSGLGENKKSPSVSSPLGAGKANPLPGVNKPLGS